ncbi:MAG: hypothetical protein H0Z19_05140 [Archaeoglobus sp.]|uniref:hypothetical protein n=1 Tax=Archaeoglobus sp. TaxID=1872626 RepID=UPI001DA03CC0|nr:hypothetical protein [Archaeoglobus sp.]MBO8179852.1 hypothetical protein [Archaeoglobus sp.]
MRSACVQDPEVGPTSNIVRLFRHLQPTEQKRVLDILQDELHKTGFECTYCGRRVRDPVWLANLPLCRSCHQRIFSPVEKRRMVYGKW